MIRAIIVDDEPGCITNLQHHLSICSTSINVVATASTISDARRIISENKFEVAFLDIQLFNENIFDLVEEIDKPAFDIIFVTAYDSFAIRAFKVEAVDYLLKPLSKSDVEKCCRKIARRLNGERHIEQALTADKTPQRKLILRQGEAMFVIRETDVYYAKAKGFYTEVVFNYRGKDMVVLVSKPISLIEKEYNSNDFFRIHKSYLINVRQVVHIVKTENTSVKLKNDEMLPIAKRRVAEFISFVNRVI